MPDMEIIRTKAKGMRKTQTMSKKKIRTTLIVRTRKTMTKMFGYLYFALDQKTGDGGPVKDFLMRNGYIRRLIYSASVEAVWCSAIISCSQVSP